MLNLSHFPPSPGAAMLPLAVQELLSKLSKALRGAITSFSLFDVAFPGLHAALPAAQRPARCSGNNVCFYCLWPLEVFAFTSVLH